SLDDPPSIDTRYEPPRSAPVFLIRGAEPGGEERLLRVDPIDEDPGGEHDRDDADGAPEDERPAEEADQRAEIARVADPPVRAARRQLVTRLDRDETAEALPEDEHRPDAERAADGEHRDAGPARRVAVDGPGVATIHVGHQPGEDERSHEGRHQHQPVPDVL